MLGAAAALSWPQLHCCHGDEQHTESSRGSDLSDIMEEDEEELCSEMQLEDGRRRPSGTSHGALKVSHRALHHSQVRSRTRFQDTLPKTLTGQPVSSVWE